TDHHRNRKGDEDPLEGGPHVPPQPSPLHFPPQELQRFPGSGKHGRPQQVGEQQPGGKNRQQRGQQPPARRVAGARGGPPPGAFYDCCRCVRCCHGCRPPFRPFHCTLPYTPPAPSPPVIAGGDGTVTAVVRMRTPCCTRP